MSMKCPFVLFVGMTFSAPAFAADEGGGVRQQAMEMMQHLNFFSGSWGCTGNRIDLDSGELRAVRANLKVQPVLDEMWHQIQLNTMGDAWELDDPSVDSEAAPHQGIAMQGYDVSTEKYVEFAATSLGSYSKAKTTGWEGNKLIWKAKLHNFKGHKKLKARKTIERINDKRFKMVLEVAKGDEFVKIHEGECHKTM